MKKNHLYHSIFIQLNHIRVSFKTSFELLVCDKKFHINVYINLNNQMFQLLPGNKQRLYPIDYFFTIVIEHRC